MQLNFTPTATSQLESRFNEVESAKEKVKAYETQLKFDDGIDGKKGEKTKLELSFYVSVVLGNNRQDILDGIYYLRRNLLLNDKNSSEYSVCFDKLVKVALSSEIGASAEDINSSELKAYFDHLIENNSNAKSLLIDLGKEKGEEFIFAIAKCWQNPSPENKKTIKDLAKSLIPERPPFPTGTYGAFQDLTEHPLKDGALFNSLNAIRKEWVQGISLKH